MRILPWLLPLAMPALLHGAQPELSFRLPNGLGVILRENHDRPLVRLELQMPWGSAEEPLGKEGLGGFLVEAMAAGGAGPRGRDAFLRFLDERALRYSFSLRHGHLVWSVLSDSQGQEAAFEVVSWAVARPELDTFQVEAQRQRYFQRLRDRTARQRAEDDFLRAVGDPERARIPTESALDRIEASDLDRLARRIVRPEKAVLVILGDMNLTQARQLSALHFGAWGPAPLDPLPPATPAGHSAGPRIRVLREPGMPVEILVGAPSLDMGAAQEAVFEEVHALLRRDLETRGGAVTWRSLPGGAWVLKWTGAPGRSVMEAWSDLQAWLQRRREAAVDPREVEAIRAEQRRWDATRSLHPAEEASFIAAQVLRGAPETDQVQALQDAVRRMLDPGRLVYLVAGAGPEDAVRLAETGLTVE